MILCTLTFENVELKVSFEDLKLTDYWKPWLVSIDNLSRKMEFTYGGMDVVDWGSIGISQEAFRDTVEDQIIYPPPRTIGITLQTTEDTQEDAVTLLEVKGAYSSIDETTVFYDFYVEETNDVNLLETTEDIVCSTTVTSYDGEVTDIPRAVGTIEYQEPLRLNDYSGSPRYHTHYLTGTLGAGIEVFDDGVNITANATLGVEGTSGENTFYLNFTAVGKVTISGSGTFTAGNNSLKNAIEYLWAARTGDSTVNASSFRSTSDEIGNWASEQKTLRKYISELAASYGHLLRLRDGVFDGLKLEARGLGTNVQFKDVEILPSVYEENRGPISIVKSDLTYRYAFTKDDSTTTYPYSDVKEEKIPVSRKYSTFYEGTLTGESTGKLVDSSGGFLSKPTAFYGGDLARPSMFIKNITTAATAFTPSEAYVISIESDSTLILDADAAQSIGEEYEIGYQFIYGNEVMIPSFSNDVGDVSENLKHIISFLHSRQVSIKVPMTNDQNLDYGDQISIVERQRYLKPLIIGYGKVIGKIYDFENELVIYKVIGTAYTEEPRIPRTDFSAKSSCMGAWFMNSIHSTIEYDRSGKQEDLTITTDSGGEVTRKNSELPEGFKGFYKEFNSDDSEYMSIADGNFTDISGADQELSLFLRFRVTEDASGSYLISKSSTNNRQYQIKINSTTDQIYFYTTPDGSTITQAKSRRAVTENDGWVTVGVVYNDTDIRIYINGVLDSNGSDNPKTYSSGIYDGTADFLIGCYGKNTAFFNGDIFEVGVWDEAFSADEMSWLHLNGIKGDKGLSEERIFQSTTGWDYSSLSSCKGAWLMNGTGSTETDQSGSGSDLITVSSDSDGEIDRGNTDLPDGFTGYYRKLDDADGEYLYNDDSGSALDIYGEGYPLTFFMRFRYASGTGFVHVLMSRGDYDSGGVKQYALSHTYLPPFVTTLKGNIYYDGSNNEAVSAGIDGSEIANTEWHTISLVYDGEYVKLYIDGVVIRVNKVGSIDVNSSDGPFTLGGADGSGFFAGDIYEAGVWDTALNKNQILEIHRFGIKGDQGASE